jgi:hypothetical protein
MICDNQLNGGLCSSVWICRSDGALLWDWYHVGKSSSVAIDGRRRGEDDIGHVVLGHAAKEGDCATNIDAVVLEGNFGGFANSLKGPVNTSTTVIILFPPLLYERDCWAECLTFSAAKWITLSISGWAAKTFSRAASSVMSAS